MLLGFGLLATRCGTTPQADGGTDSAADALQEAASDSPQDAPADAAVADAPADAAVADARADAALDSAAEAGPDAALDASAEASAEAGRAETGAGCITITVNASTHVLRDPSDLATALTDMTAPGATMCSVLSSDASPGSGALFTKLLFVSGADFAVLPTSGAMVPCTVTASGRFHLEFIDNYLTDNRGMATVRVGTSVALLDPTTHVGGYPSSMPNAATGTLSAGMHTCRVTTSDARSSPGALYPAVLFSSSGELTRIPTDGTTVPCAFNAADFRLMFTDDAPSDNTGSATVQVCP